MLIICLLITREPLPTMFSMQHPLDEITPLVCKSGSKYFLYILFHSSFFAFGGGEIIKALTKI